jgi:phosphopantetheinyl transferase
MCQVTHSASSRAGNDAFFTLRTPKEAVVKALGHSLVDYHVAASVAGARACPAWLERCA